ncbi:hypothetical protein B0H13DRAFT_797118 [Mycena leptocephala]|nr:hypothetical protein B0H13DRAFT_797118 [Mycena leptocephala]
MPYQSAALFHGRVRVRVRSVPVSSYGVFTAPRPRPRARRARGGERASCAWRWWMKSRSGRLRRRRRRTGGGGGGGGDEGGGEGAGGRETAHAVGREVAGGGRERGRGDRAALLFFEEDPEPCPSAMRRRPHLRCVRLRGTGRRRGRGRRWRQRSGNRRLCLWVIIVAGFCVGVSSFTVYGGGGGSAFSAFSATIAHGGESSQKSNIIKNH